MKKKRSHPNNNNKKDDHNHGDNVLIFQDVIDKCSGDNDEALSLAFFELANVPRVGYRVKKKKIVTVHQDVGACGQHTGGIVWETSYLLMNFLLAKRVRLGNVLEVGAGCGLLGRVLSVAGLAKRVVMTETNQALTNLQKNNNNTFSKNVSVQKLDWLDPNNHDGVYDTIVGTDVVFARSLVKPLLSTMQRLSHAQTKVYLCLQIRCADSHALFLSSCPEFQWKQHDLTPQLADVSGCAWGLAMECRIYQLERITTTEENQGDGSSQKRKKNNDESNSETKRKRKKTRNDTR